jgi:hypothetical protein
MGLGNGNPKSGNKGSNFSFEHRQLILLGETLQSLGLVASEATLLSVLNAIVAHQDWEVLLVRDKGAADLVVQQIREYDETTQTWTTSYQDVSGNPYVPVGPLEYLDPSAVLNLVLSELIDQGITLDQTLIAINDILNTIHLEVDDDAIAVEQLLPTNINLLYGAFEGEGTEWERIQTDGNGQLKGIQDIIDELQATLDVNVTNATLAVTQSGAWTITSNQGTSPWVVSGTVALDAATLAALETITVNQGTNPWTVNGTVNAAQSGVWTVALDAATLAALETITVEQGTSPWVVSSVDLDIRDLTFASDKVDASGSNVNSRTQDGVGTSITSTTVGLDTGLDVNIIGGAVLDVNLDQNNDQVQVYGSDLTAPIATDTAGHLQVDILTIPEVEVKNDAGNPIPISDAGGSITVDGSVTVSSTDLDIRDLVFATDKVDVSGSSNVAVTDGGGSLTVDGTVAATQSGTWDINNISGTVSLPTGAATEATLTSIDTDTGNIATSTSNIDGSTASIKQNLADVTGTDGAAHGLNQKGVRALGTTGGGNDEQILVTPDGEVVVDGIAELNTALTPTTRTHNTVSATGVGSVPAGSMCGSVINAGNAAGTWNGISLPAGISIPWTQIGNRDTYGSIAYDATGTTFIIEYTT